MMDRLTNICEATSQSLDFDSFRPTHRKGKKLMAEKKRRARINSCLMRIRDIVCNGDEDKETDLDKMEKAEILERTLDVLTRVRHDFETSRKMNSASTQKAMAVRYASGFTSCAEESIRYIQNSRLVPLEVKHQLQAHLRTIARSMETTVQDEQDSSHTHFYPTPPSIVIESPRIATVPSTTTNLPHLMPTSSLSLVLPVNNDSTPTLQITSSSDSRNVSCSYPSEIMMTPSQLNWKQSSSIPSPILSSTPVPHAEDNKPSSPISNKVFHMDDNSRTFIPVANIEFSQDYKENRSTEYHPNIPVHSYSQQNESESSSAFYRVTPQVEDQSQSQRMTRTRSCSSSSPSGFSSSQYSPVSPVPLPALMQTPTGPYHSTIHKHQPVFTYHGYEPYPVRSTSPDTSNYNTSTTMPVVGSSPSEFQYTPSKAIDLCIKRNDSHNISPETMWRPW